MSDIAQQKLHNLFTSIYPNVNYKPLERRWRDPKTHSWPAGGPGGEERANGVSVRERAKVAVQLCGWVQGQGQLGYLELRGLFEGVLKLEPTWEKGHFHFARWGVALSRRLTVGPHQDSCGARSCSETSAVVLTDLGGSHLEPSVDCCKRRC